MVSPETSGQANNWTSPGIHTCYTVQQHGCARVGRGWVRNQGSVLGGGGLHPHSAAVWGHSCGHALQSGRGSHSCTHLGQCLGGGKGEAFV